MINLKKIFFCFYYLLFVGANLMAENLIVHYNRIEDDYDGWKLWVWNKTDSKEGFEVTQYGKDSFGVYFFIDIEKEGLSNKEIGLLPKYGDWEKKESFDRVFKHNNEKEIFIVEGDTNVYRSISEILVSTRVVASYFDDTNLVRVVFNRRVNLDFLKKEDFYIDNKTNIYKPIDLSLSKDKKVGYLKFESLLLSFDMINKGEYILKSNNFESRIFMGNIMYNKDYFYSDKEFGVIKEENNYLFRVFSPNSIEVYLVLKKSKNDEEKEYKMSYVGKGVWEYKDKNDLDGYYYRYKVVYFDNVLYGIDPYARLTVDNNKWAVINFDNTPIYPSPKFDISQSIIYEMSIRDLTSDVYSGVKNKKKYLGITEEDTHHPKNKEIKTGISHLKELGINCVHILPFYDFENDENSDSYDWGYMPVSFNSPEGQYAVDKFNKIKEAKAMISALHKNGIKVIMDVVYNHTAETKDKVYNFNALAYDYYYRKKEDGSYYNGSGCGNEFMSDSPMGRKFIIDSLKYWVNEYKIDGFRFDLMGLIDLETVKEIVKEIRKINPDIIIYGEPWSAGQTPIRGVSKGSQKNLRFAVFNDDFRDGLKGNVFRIEDLGYVQVGKNKDTIKKGLKGSIDIFTNSPLETINYVTSHDNHTLFDKLSLSQPNLDEKYIVDEHKLAHALVFVSQGIPFFLSGEEMLRTKYGNENSYNAGDNINKIDWTRKEKYLHEINYYFKDLIRLRKEHKAFRMTSKEDVIENIRFYEDLGLPLPDDKSIAFLINGRSVGDIWNEILVLVNPKSDSVNFILPKGEWSLVFDNIGLKEDGLIFVDNIKVKGKSLFILKK